jgi:Flp pilus assembly protein TadD
VGRITAYIELLQKGLLLLGTLLALVTGLILLLRLDTGDSIVVGKFDVGENLTRLGYTPLAIARQVKDRLQSMARETTTTKRIERVQTADEGPTVQVRTEDLSVQGILQMVKDWRRSRSFDVTGEMVEAPDSSIYFSVRVNDHPANLYHGSTAEVEELITQAAEGILAESDPYVLAAYYIVHTRWDDALRQIYACLAREDNGEKHWAYNLRGVYFLEQDRFEEAAERFKQAVALKPDFGIALFNWGLALQELDGSPDRAIEKFKEALRVWPSDVVCYNLGQAYIAKAQYDAAIEALGQCEGHGPKQAQILAEAGRAYFAKGDYERALQKFNEAADLTEPDEQLLKLTGQTLEMLGFESRAQLAFKRAAQVSAKPE